MKAVLISIDGVLADHRQRQHLLGSPDYFKREVLLKDAPTPDSVRCLQELTQRYEIVYLTTRPEAALPATAEWLAAMNFPKGSIFCGTTLADRLALAPQLREQFDFAAGIGSHWDDNTLHLELYTRSIILQEFAVDWEIARKFLLGREHTALQQALHLLEKRARKITEPAAHRMDVYLAPGHLLPMVKSLHDARWGFLTAITGLDDVKAGEIEVLYHFVSGPALVNLRVRIPREAAAIPSVCHVIPAATFFERELSEMFGVNVLGTPNPDRLFLPDEWPQDVYPLRKDFVPSQN
jgi:Ni,Fe-hydrogenase III component G